MTGNDGFSVFKNRLELEGTLTTVTALRIGSGRSLDPVGTDLPVIKDAFDRPLIPGSSFKGAMRSRLESFLRGVVGDNRKLVANPAIEAEWSLTSAEIRKLKNMDFEELTIWCWAKTQEDAQLSSFESRYALIELRRAVNQRNHQPSPSEASLLAKLPSETELKAIQTEKYISVDAALTRAILQETDLVSSVFGSPWQSSKFQVRDLSVNLETWFGQYQERDGVSIDRDTETAADGRLYDFQVVPAGVEFDFKAVFENAEDWELGLLAIGLQQFAMQQIPLGGGVSRGLGVVELDINKVIWIDPIDRDGKLDPLRIIEYMQQLSDNNLSQYERSPEHFDELKRDWTKALIDYLSLLASGMSTSAMSNTESAEAAS